MVNKFVRSILYMILLVAIPGAIFFLLPARVGYQVTERYAFSAGQAGSAFGLAVLLPVSGPYQEISAVQVEWAGAALRQPYGEVEAVLLEPLATERGLAEAKISYTVSLAQGKIGWDGGGEEKYLRPQQNIESDAAELASAAQAICAGAAGDPAYPIYAFTAGYLAWPTGDRTGVEPSALAAYRSRVGVCGEFANLMTALSRACGVPARSIGGLSMPTFAPPLAASTKTWNHPGGAHAWVEVYTGGQWRLADPSWASGMPFDRLWFGRSLGQYLSYGEAGEQERVYQQLMAWGEQRGAIIGAMSAPIKFVAVSSAGKAAVEPSVQVKKVSDPRWVLAAAAFLLLAFAANRVESRRRP